MKACVLLVVLLGVCLTAQANILKKKVGTCNTDVIRTQVLQVVQDLEDLGENIEGDVTTLINALNKCEKNILKIIPCINNALQTGQQTVIAQIQTFMSDESPMLLDLLNEVLACLAQ